MRGRLSFISVAAAVAACGMVAATPAMAADLYVPDPVYDWSGLYGGVNIGYGFGGRDKVGIAGQHVGRLKPDGVFGGAQIGYNYQFDENWVVGLETDFQGADIKDHKSGSGFRARSKIDWFGTLRGRVGYAWDNVLFYGTGGLAYGHNKYRVSPLTSKKFTKAGWTAGGGVEYAFDQDWSAKVEYLYVNLGRKTLHGPQGSKTHASPDFHSVRAGVNYHF